MRPARPLAALAAAAVVLSGLAAGTASASAPVHAASKPKPASFAVSTMPTTPNAAAR